MNPFHVSLDVPFSVASVSAEGTTLGLLLAARRPNVFHQVMLPAVRFQTLVTLVSVREWIRAFFPGDFARLAIDLEITCLVGISFGLEFARFARRRRLERLIVLPDDQFT